MLNGILENENLLTIKEAASIFKTQESTLRSWIRRKDLPPNLVLKIGGVVRIRKALHYQYMTGKKAMVVLILENPKTEMVYFNRVKKLGQIYGFDVEYVTPEILHIKDGRCPYLDCKCNKKK